MIRDREMAKESKRQVTKKWREKLVGGKHSAYADSILFFF